MVALVGAVLLSCCLLRQPASFSAQPCSLTLYIFSIENNLKNQWEKTMGARDFYQGIFVALELFYSVPPLRAKYPQKMNDVGIFIDDKMHHLGKKNSIFGHTLVMIFIALF